MEEIYVKAGKLFCFSEGEYSDYHYVGHFLALVDITTATVKQAKDNALKRIMSGEYRPNGDKIDISKDRAIKAAQLELFIPELIRQGVMLDVDCKEIYIGSYGELDL